MAEEPKPAAPAAPKVDLSKIPATVIRMPALSDTMTEGIIEKWNFKVGDKVKSDDSLADVATDKATMEVVGYEAGTLLYIGVEEGKAAPVNGIIAIVGKEGTDITPLLQDAAAPAAATAAPAEAPAAAETAPAAATATNGDDSRVKASPLARKIAKDKGITRVYRHRKIYRETGFANAQGYCQTPFRKLVHRAALLCYHVYRYGPGNRCAQQDQRLRSKQSVV